MKAAFSTNTSVVSIKASNAGSGGWYYGNSTLPIPSGKTRIIILSYRNTVDYNIPTTVAYNYATSKLAVQTLHASGDNIEVRYTFV